MPATARCRLAETPSWRLARAASPWEISISIKAGLGSLKIKLQEVFDAIEPAGFDFAGAGGARRRGVFLGAGHGDPFDRLLVAQAMLERILLRTCDEALVGYRSLVRLVE